MGTYHIDEGPLGKKTGTMSGVQFYLCEKDPSNSL